MRRPLASLNQPQMLRKRLRQRISLEKMDAIDREGLVYTILVSETRPPLSAKKWRPNLKRVTAAVMQVTAASGPPMRIPSIRVNRKRLHTLPKDHCPSNMGSSQA